MNSELAFILATVILFQAIPLSLAGFTNTIIKSQTEKEPQPKDILVPIIIFIMINVAFYLLFLV